MTTYTDAQILSAIHETMAARDFETCASLVCLLATQAPDAAELILAAIEGKAGRNA